MTELFKLFKGMYDPTSVPCFYFIELSEDSIMTRGNIRTYSTSLSLRVFLRLKEIYLYQPCYTHMEQFIQ